MVNVSVLGKRFEYGDNQISIIGILDNEKVKPKKSRTDSSSTISSISSVEEGLLDDLDPVDEDEEDVLPNDNKK